MTGTLEQRAGEELFRLVAASDSYYEGMHLWITVEVAVMSTTGAEVAVEDLKPGERVDVWLADGGCNESNPVQCDLATVRLDG